MVRLRRCDDEPWHLWDLAEKRGGSGPSPAALLRPLKGLCADAHALERLRGVLPPVLPSLGILHKLGVRFRLRLHCACALANQGAKKALNDDIHLARGLNVAEGEVTFRDAADDLGVPCVKPDWLTVL